MTDYTPYKELYLKCFTEDTEEDAELLFKTVLSKAERVCEYHEGNPIAMLFLMDSNLRACDVTYPFFYLYAACTHPDHRGKGIMGELLQKAKEIALNKGKLGIFLKPANPPLFNFYAKSDFMPFFKITKVKTTAATFLHKVHPDTCQIFEMSMDEWQLKRKEFLNSLCDIYADFSNDLFSAATAGCRVLIGNHSALVYELRDDTLLIKEALCHSGYEKEMLNMSALLLNETKATNIELRFPTVYNTDAFKELNTETSYFSVLWDNGVLPKDSFKAPYHGFAFD